MKKKRVLAVVLSVVIVITFTACSSSISQEEYDAVAAELETVKAENDKLNKEIEGYKEYDDIINPIKNEDYSGALDAVWSRVPAKEKESERSDDTVEVTEENLIGTWVSSVDQNCSFELCENHEAKIGEHICTWSLDSGGYGPLGIVISMDDGIGWYSWIFWDGDPTVLLGNGYATGIPDYLDPDSFGSKFYKK